MEIKSVKLPDDQGNALEFGVRNEDQERDAPPSNAGCNMPSGNRSASK
jgi:hypothetical protein